MRSTIVALSQLAALVVFVVLCAAIPRAKDCAQKRRRILAFTAYLVMIHIGIGITQKDGWPIANYRLMHGLANPGSELWRVGLFGVDASGREWRVDPYAWRSISDWHLQFWFIREFEKVSSADRESVLRVLYERAEENRAFIAERERLPRASILGPLTAPQWWLFDREKAAPRQPYQKIRVYKDVWLWKEKLETGRPSQRKLLAEWSPR